jgi:hypothetical protein
VAYRGLSAWGLTLKLRFPGCLCLCIPGVLLVTY